MKMLKTKWIALCMMLMLVFGMSMHTQAAATIYEENGFYYSLELGKAYVEGYYGTNPVMRIPTTLGGCTVVGINSMTNGSIKNYREYVQELYIPDTVTTVDGGVYFESDVLRKVWFSSNMTTLPLCTFRGSEKLEFLENTVGITKLDYATFESCPSLKRVSFPNLITTGGNVFLKCTSLVSVDMPKLQKMDYGNFNGCVNLSQVNMPSLTSIGSSAFYRCSSLTSFTIPDTCKSIGASTFQGTGLREVIIPSSVTEILHSSFTDCAQLRTVTIYGPIDRLYGDMFAGCTSLTSVTLPNTVKSIYWRSFKDCKSLQSLSIPMSVTSIDGSAFEGCERLTMLYVYEGTAGEKFAKTKGIPYQSKTLKPAITLDKEKATLYLSNGYKTTTINVKKENTTQAVKFKSSKKSVATVSSSGKITAKKAGNTTITVTCGTLKKTCKITVKKPSLKVKKSSVTLKKGKETTIKCTVAPSSAVVKFTTTNKKIATVSSKGVIKARKKGTCYIKVTLNGASTKKVKVKVK